jgi:hypothetical protein
MGIGITLRYWVQSGMTGQIVGTQLAVGIGGGMLNVLIQSGGRPCGRRLSMLLVPQFLEQSGRPIFLPSYVNTSFQVQ